MRFHLISCEVLFREMCDAVARSPHQISVQFLSKGLHDLGGKRMRQSLQEQVDQAAGCDAVLMGYALCGNGLNGLEARTVPLVLPRAHDCIALLMGSRSLYQDYFEANPGTHFRSTGWIERGQSLRQLAPGEGLAGESLDDLIARFGEDNGQYLYEELSRYRRHYRQLTFIETGLEPDARFEDEARREASGRGWTFSKVSGSLSLFKQLVNGDWPAEHFLVVPPGARAVASYDEGVIRLEGASS